MLSGGEEGHGNQGKRRKTMMTKNLENQKVLLLLDIHHWIRKSGNTKVEIRFEILRELSWNWKLKI